MSCDARGGKEVSDSKMCDSWTHPTLDRLVIGLCAPDFWSPESPVTYGLLEKIVTHMEEKGVKHATLPTILLVLKPDINVNEIPQMCNIKRKLRSKMTNPKNKVPWTEPKDNQERLHLGPYCRSQNVTVDVLQGDSELPQKPIITNGLILELRAFWKKKVSTWKIFRLWLVKLGVEGLSEQNTRHRVNAVHQKYLSVKTKVVDCSEFLEELFNPSPRETSTVPSPQIDDFETNTPSLNIKVLVSQPSSTTASTETNTEPPQEPEIGRLEQLDESMTDLIKVCHALEDSQDKEATITKLHEKLASYLQELQLCKARLRMNKKNYSRREERRNAQIEKNQVTIEELNTQLLLLKGKCDEMEKGKIQAERKCQYVNRKHRKLQEKFEQQQVDAQIASHALREKEQELNQLSDQLHSTLNDKLQVDCFTDGRYSDDLRQTVMALGSLGLGAKNIANVIETVASGLFGVTIPQLPSDTTIKTFLLEANIVGKMQVCKTLLSTENTTLHADGTSDHQRHFFAYQVTTGAPSNTYALGVSETVSSDTDTQLDELCRIIEDFSALVTTNVDEREVLKGKMLMSFRNLMSDQHIVNKKFKEDLEKLRLSILTSTESSWGILTEEEKEESVKLHHWFCFLHVLLGLADATEDALESYEDILTLGGSVLLGRQKIMPDNKKEKSAVTEAIKAACSLLTPSGHPAAGISSDFRAWMTSQGKKIHFVKFSHNRFNVLFQNASALYYHLEDIRQFLQDNTHSNQLVEAVRGDLADDVLMACVRGVAMFHQTVTAPFHALVLDESTAHILDLNSYMEKMRLALEEMSSVPWCVLTEGYAMWKDRPPHANPVYNGIMSEPLDEENLQFTMEALSMVATYSLVTFTRQMSPQLPGGVHSTSKVTETLLEESKSVPTSNSIGESQFAYLKYLRSIKPNATVENIEGSIMWAYNKSLSWLQSLDGATRSHVLQMARTRCAEFKEKWAGRRKLLQEKRLLHLKQKEEKQQTKEQKAVVERQKNLDDVHKLGGQCQTAEEVDKLVEKHGTNGKELLQALKSQIRFFKTVIKPPGVDKVLLQFSHQGKQFDCARLATNLKTVIKKYNDYLTGTPSASSEPQIPDASARKEGILLRKKQVLCSYQTMDEEGSTSPCRKGQKRKGSFPNSPVGKRFRHRWNVPGRKSKQWFPGIVVGICEAGEDPYDRRDVEDNLATRLVYTLFKVRYDGDEETYNLRLEKDWAKKDLHFVEDEVHWYSGVNVHSSRCSSCWRHQFNLTTPLMLTCCGYTTVPMHTLFHLWCLRLLPCDREIAFFTCTYVSGFELWLVALAVYLDWLLTVFLDGCDI